MAKSSTRCGKPKLLSKDGGTTTTPNDPIVHWAIARLRQKPPYRWTKGQSCTNFQIGPLKWGCSPSLIELQSFSNNDGILAVLESDQLEFFQPSEFISYQR
jgi:hypothetical protein